VIGDKPLGGTVSTTLEKQFVPTHILDDQSGAGKLFKNLQNVKLSGVDPVFLNTPFVAVTLNNEVSPLTIAGDIL
jgi:hypothetical protein